MAESYPRVECKTGFLSHFLKPFINPSLSNIYLLFHNPPSHPQSPHSLSHSTFHNKAISVTKSSFSLIFHPSKIFDILTLNITQIIKSTQTYDKLTILPHSFTLISISFT